MALKFAMVLQLVDRASGPAKRARAGVEKLTGGVRRMATQVSRSARAVDRGERSLEHYQRRARRMRGVALGRTFQAIGREARGMARDIGRGVRQLKLMERAGNAAKRGFGWVGNKLLSTAKWGAAAGLAAAGYSVFDMFKDAGKAEQAQAELAGFLGSAEKARAEFDRLKRADYGVGINELLASYVELRKGGIDPAARSIQAMADEARSSGRTFTDIVEAVTKARMGSGEGLERLNIRAITKGGVVTKLQYLDSEGKRISKSVGRSADDIERALIDIFDERSGGAAKRYGKTFAGMIDGLKNRWNRFQLMVADAGIFDKVKAGLDRFLTRFDGWVRDGKIEAWAKSVSEWLEKAWDWGVAFAERTDWGAMAKGLSTAVNVLTRIIELIGKAAAAYEEFNKARDIRLLKGMENSWFASDERKAAARSVRHQRYGTERYKDWRGRRGGSGRDLNLDNLSPIPRRNPKVSMNGAAQPVQVGGKTQIDIAVKGPATARVRSHRTDNADIASVVRLGKSMRLAA